jgi:hypothetical protein
LTPTEFELIAIRDEDAMNRFYERHVAVVRQFCAAICPPERIEEAVEAAMLIALARASEASVGGRPEDVVRKATREVAAARMAPGVGTGQVTDPVCRAVPELLAARANGELRGPDGPLAEHLSSCAVCQMSAARLQEAESAFLEWANGEPVHQAESTQLVEHPSEARQPWEPASELPPSGAREDAASKPSPQNDLTPPAAQSARVHNRRGGLVGAVKRAARSRRDRAGGR